MSIITFSFTFENIDSAHIENVVRESILDMEIDELDKDETEFLIKEFTKYFIDYLALDEKYKNIISVCESYTIEPQMDLVGFKNSYKQGEYAT